VITLTVIAFNDTPADGTLQVRFDELGGSIGRAASNQLVLPDPERMVSRVAAQVVYRNGGFAIIDRGSNPISLNGRALASGREAPLVDGDRVHICGYELSVKMGGAVAVSSDPFSKLLGPAPAARAPGASLVDPLARSGVRPQPAAPAPPAGGIPIDWDPFATQPQDRPAPGAPPRDALGLDLGAGAPAPLIAGLGVPSAAPSSLDLLFGLSPSAGGDPLSNSALDAPMAQPNMAADADPLRSLNSAPKASAASEPDRMSDLQRPFIPPTIIKPAAPPAAAPTAAAARAWASPGHDEKTRALDMPAAPPKAHVDAAPARPAAAPPAAPRGRVEDGAALLEAFRRGLNAPALEMPALTPEMMELIGQLLHEAVGGTVELLRARSTLKHEMRADVTTIVAKDNNPLKFSPNAEVALQHLLAPPARGFTPAAPAMRAAFDDLRTHQFGLLAGMQAVLEAALQRFDPVALEAKLGGRSRLQHLLPARRNAKLWELFTESYASIRKDAADDFHALFGSVFVKAYDEQVNRLLRHRRGGAR